MAIVTVPSVMVPFAQNYIINPRHQDATRIRVARILRTTLTIRAAVRAKGGRSSKHDYGHARFSRRQFIRWSASWW